MALPELKTQLLLLIPSGNLLPVVMQAMTWYLSHTTDGKWQHFHGQVSKAPKSH